MTRDPFAPVAADGRVARPRASAWFGAVLLCVLLAATGLSRGAVDLADRVNVELGETHGPRGCGAPLRRTDTDAAAGHAAVPCASSARPRVVGRQRSIGDGGLPPARAPTC